MRSMVEILTRRNGARVEGLDAWRDEGDMSEG